MDRAKSSTTNLDLKNKLYLSYSQISISKNLLRFSLYDIKPNIMEIHSRLLKDP